MSEVAKVYSATDITWGVEFTDGRIFYLVKREHRDEPDLNAAIACYEEMGWEGALFQAAVLRAIRDHEMTLV